MPGLLTAGLVVGVGYFLYRLLKGGDGSDQGQGATPTSSERHAPSPTQASHRYYAEHAFRTSSRPSVNNNIDRQTHQVPKPQTQAPQTSTNDERLFNQYNQQPLQYGATGSSASVSRPSVNDGIYAPQEHVLPCGCRDSIHGTRSWPYDYEESIYANTYPAIVSPAPQSRKPVASVARQQKPKPNAHGNLQAVGVKQRLSRVDIKASGIAADVHIEALITIELDPDAEDSDILATAKRFEEMPRRCRKSRKHMPREARKQRSEAANQWPRT
ncbi:hypothetical protein EWM64_g3762 [Hericium alpestre]|uniref:Uncharacterized protein n=1 Tax=Hericium alpestre TaxID=135208 RepID=A0A4Z0A226_9AGAM|nr:hypothetical protein EWM64_g3762 [Hericium alpestre]